MLNIKIGKYIVGCVDDRNFGIGKNVVIKDRKTGKDKPSFKWIGYYPTLELALYDIMNKTLLGENFSENEVQTANEIMDEIRSLKREIVAAVASAKNNR